MHAPVALLTAALLLRHAHANPHNTTSEHSFSSDVIDRAISAVFGSAQESQWPHQRVVECAQAAGPLSCLRAFSAWRADHALESLERIGEARSSFDEDLRMFPWKKYTNISDDVLESKLCEGTSRLLQGRSLTLSSIPGYRLELESKSGTLSVDVFKDQSENGEARGVFKKLRKRFLYLLPIFLLPGLLMSAILPFFLPALKMMTFGVGMMNQMALTGAIFTLLRNNAFNDKYDKKVIYINSGYKNEHRHRPLPIIEEDVIHTHTIDGPDDVGDGAYYGEHSHTHDVYDVAASAGYEPVAEPANNNWVTRFYGGEQYYAPADTSSSSKKKLKGRRDKVKPHEHPEYDERRY